MGSMITGVALPLIAVTMLDATPVETGLLAAAGYAAWLIIGLPAGSIVQGLPLRGVQVAMDVVRALAVGSIPLAWLLGHVTMAHLVLVALVVSFGRVIYETSAVTLLPSIVEPELLRSRNSVMAGTGSVADLAGPALAGILVQTLGAALTLVVDVISYGVSAALLATLPERRISDRRRSPPVRALIREGWTYVFQHPVLAPLLRSSTMINLTCGAQLALFPVFLIRELQAPVALVGILLASEGAGALAGAALTTRLARWLGSARTLIASGLAATAGAVVLPLGTGVASYAVFVAGNGMFAGSVAVASVLSRTYQQEHNPMELLPRVVATTRFVSFGAVPVGALAAGALAGLIGSREALIVVGCLTILAPMALIASPVRHRRDLSDEPADLPRT
jgi:MFS family permease